MRHRMTGGLAGMVLVCVASCGGGGDETAEIDGVEGSADASTGDGGSGPNGLGADGDEEQVEQNQDVQDQEADQNQLQDADPGSVDGPPWGPDDPIVPGRYGALHPVFTDTLECATAAAEGEGEFWQFVGAACLAALGQGAWPGGAIPSPPPTDNPYTACLDVDVVAWLQRLEAHFAVQSEPPELVVPAARPPDSCRTRVYVFDAVRSGEGVQVEVAMELPNDAVEEVLPEVRVDGVPAEVVDTTGSFKTPQLLGTTYFIAGPFDGDSIEIEGTNLLGTSTVAIAIPPEAADLTDDEADEEFDDPADSAPAADGDGEPPGPSTSGGADADGDGDGDDEDDGG